MKISKATTEILAKIFSREKISIIFEPTSTASFDLQNRVLSLPNYTDKLDEETQLMFILHEVAHALYTPTEEWLRVLSPEYLKKNKLSKSFKDFLNIVEDHRIDRIQKKKYPGARKWYYKGGENLFERGFFGEDSATAELRAKLPLIDRLNLFSKTGMSAPVNFSPEEEKYVKMFNETVTFEDVIRVAKEIYNFDRYNLFMHGDMSSGFESGSDEDSLTLEEQGWGGGKDFDGNFPESHTAREYEFKMETEVTSNKGVYYYDFPYVINPQKNILSAESLISYGFNFDNPNQTTDQLKALYGKSLSQWLAKKRSYINMLAKRFELKKSARLMEKSQTHKTGVLDVNKLHGYKYIEDLFKTNTIVKKGKNHGLIFIVDWSGSMSHILNKVIEQVIVLAEFCKRTNIPFEIYAFHSENYIKDFSEEEVESRILGSGDNRKFKIDCTMVELLSSRMSSKLYADMMLRLYTSTVWPRGRGLKCYGIPLGGTPLHETIMWLRSYIEVFKEKHNVEILNSVILSDGMGYDLNQFMGRSFGYNFENEKATHIFVDKKTGKQFQVKDSRLDLRYGTGSLKEMRILLEMTQEVTNTNILGYYVAESPSDISKFYNLKKNRGQYEQERNNLRVKGYTILPPEVGFSEYYGFYTHNMQEDKEMDLQAGSKKSDIMKAIREDKKTKDINKFFVNRFVDKIS